jgi:hypothetical protein
MKRRLLIVSASVRTTSGFEKLRAIELFDGIFARAVRKYIREGFIDRRDVFFVSPTLGLIRGTEPLDLGHTINTENWHKPKIMIDKEDLLRLNDRALSVLREAAGKTEYVEAYVNVGKSLTQIINGIDTVLRCPIIYAHGRGIGPKTAHMKAWVKTI